MAFWTKLFGRRNKCGMCGRTLQKEVHATPRGHDPFADAVQRVAGALALPAYACDKCGVVVCVGCLPMDGSRPCPKCG